MIQTSAQFADARHKLDLSISQCARLLNVEEGTLRKWEAPAERGGRPPHPSACRILQACFTDRSVFRMFVELGRT